MVRSAGCGSVWLERTAGGREVAGSNPVTPIPDHIYVMMKEAFYKESDRAEENCRSWFLICYVGSAAVQLISRGRGRDEEQDRTAGSAARPDGKKE